jgi:hypothetical protein
MPRRKFLTGAAAAAAGLTVATPAQTARTPAPAGSEPGGLPRNWRRMRKLDAHGHVAGARHGRQWSPAAVLVDACDRLGIEHIWCSIPIAGGALVSPEVVHECNDGVMAAMRHYPGRIGGWCFVQPGTGLHALDEIDRCLDAGMQGVKLYNQYRFSDPVVFPIAEKCIRHGIPVLGHAAHVTDPERRATQPNSSRSGGTHVGVQRRPAGALVPRIPADGRHGDGRSQTGRGVRCANRGTPADRGPAPAPPLGWRQRSRVPGHRCDCPCASATSTDASESVMELTQAHHENIAWRNAAAFLRLKL